MKKKRGITMEQNKEFSTTSILRKQRPLMDLSQQGILFAQYKKEKNTGLM